MFALGHKQTYRYALDMAALPPKAAKQISRDAFARPDANKYHKDNTDKKIMICS